MRQYEAFFFKDKSPNIDAIKTELQDVFGTRRLTRKHYKMVEDHGGPKVQTLAGWFDGDTISPQDVTLEATGRSVGLKRVWVPMRESGLPKWVTTSGMSKNGKHKNGK